VSDTSLHLFEATGIELEYMIVDDRRLSVMPIADKILAAVAGKIVSDIELGAIAWSNELVLHVIELKTNGPAVSLSGLGKRFQEDIDRIHKILRPLGARLMPTAAHPWMNPLAETVLWPHDYSPVYEAYDRIFGCRGHGWSNLQSTHINLPFSGDAEFAALHAAIRFLLPILPALTASSPILDGKPTGLMDSRLEVYRHNAARIPSIAGLIVPEPVSSRKLYDREIFQRMYADIRPFDPDGILQQEFLNSRGAIARFDRGAIEIRVLDIQEIPKADVAIAGLIMAVLKRLCRNPWVSLETLNETDTRVLADLFLMVIRQADETLIDIPAYTEALGLRGKRPLTTRELWRHLAETCFFEENLDPDMRTPIDTLLEKGCLARRITSAIGGDARKEKLFEIYAALCDCLAEGEMFGG
jgi:gamma-glutamyl:cysteine ligase YbdK (ATP-grasp superfamily)